MKTIHLILNAHIDPIWLWPWQAGLDELLATCRSACDRLDAHPDIIFTRGEAWVYRMVQRVDPPLFERIRQHVEAGRWEIVGGWWIQPDCNFPAAVGFEKQIELGKQYFQDTFGVFPRVAYNVDSFGHAATLPDFMHRAGQDSYVMMRPADHEMKLPARVFRWRGRDGGPSVATFRIAGSYATRPGPGPGPAASGVDMEHVQKAMTELPEGIQHTMCFIGVGDHGGGPTEAQIRWCQEHADAIEGTRLVFSSPRRFFDAIGPDLDCLPLVTGELQHHAVGCYSVHRPVKTAVRRAEHMLATARIAHANDPSPEEDDARRIENGWEHVAFHHFHDTLGGTCIPSAYEQIEAELGEARAAAERIIHLSMRRRIQTLEDDAMQRVVLLNAGSEHYEGYAEFEPWLDWQEWQNTWRLLGEQHRPVPYQLMHSEAQVNGLARILARVSVAPGALCTLRIDRDGNNQTTAAVRTTPTRIETDAAVAVDLKDDQLAFGAEVVLALPRLELIEDTTDTWSHDVDRYGDAPCAQAQWDAPALMDSGPLMAALIQTGQIGRSDLMAEWRVFAQEPFIELLLRVNWCERQKVLKLITALPGAITRRLDGIPGGELPRETDGAERPLHDRAWFQLADGTNVGAVCPDVYALDATTQRTRFTLLRSPFLAHHNPHKKIDPRATLADRGEHRFRFRFFGGRIAEPALLDRHALMMHRPLVSADLTRGMKGSE